MPSYVREIKAELDFDGQHVVLLLRPFEFEDLLLMQSAGAEPQMMVTYGKLLPKYVISITGVKDAAGSDVPIDEIARMTFFAPIVGTAMRAHVTASQPTDPTLPGDRLAG
jgi:hypothetical protein